MLVSLEFTQPPTSLPPALCLSPEECNEARLEMKLSDSPAISIPLAVCPTTSLINDWPSPTLLIK